jgi:signal transduction histidine kinase
MKNSRHYRIKLIFLLSTLVLLSLSIFSYIRINKLIKTAELVNHTQRVKIALEKTFSELLQAETSQRGYLHARDSSFLEELSEALANVDHYINQVDTLTKASPSQQENVVVLRAAVNKRILYLENLLNDAVQSKLPNTRWLAGKALMLDVHRQINKMQQEQEYQIRRDTAILDKEVYFTPLFTFVLISCSLIFLVTAYFRILTELKTSDQLRLSLEQKQNELQLTNKELVHRNEETLSAINRIKQSEQALKKQARQLEDNNKALLRLNKELELFNYISSHDLQEPLRKIQIFASRIQSNEAEKLSLKGRDDLQRMQEAAFRMHTLIEDLLAYSRTTTTERTFVNTNLAEIIEDVKAGFREELRARNATIETADMCEANIIPFQFRQLMQNLLSNSLKFSSPQKPLHIRIKCSIIEYDKLKISNAELFNTGAVLRNHAPGHEPSYCHISVCDNGIGFEPQYKERIFEIFQRLHSKSAYPGTGIGLAIVKKIVENHNGVIQANSQPGEGTCFDIFIPR